MEHAGECLSALFFTFPHPLLYIPRSPKVAATSGRRHSSGIGPFGFLVRVGWCSERMEVECTGRCLLTLGCASGLQCATDSWFHSLSPCSPMEGGSKPAGLISPLLHSLAGACHCMQVQRFEVLHLGFCNRGCMFLHG